MSYLPLLAAALLSSSALPAPAAGLMAPAPAAVDYACQVKYEMSPSWQSFQSNITITNIGDATIQGWTLRFELPAGQSFLEGYSADWTGTAGPLAAVSRTWNSTVAKGESAYPGFRGTGTDLTTEPRTFTVNNIPCSVI